MSFIDDMKVFVFFGILVIVAIGGLGKRFFGWGIKPGNDSRPKQASAPAQQYPPQMQQQQQYYPQQPVQQQQYPRR